MNTTIATLIAIVLGPILAIQVQKIIESIKQRNEEKRRLFMTLMSTRGRPLVPEHVQALNMIDLIFSVKSKLMAIIFWRRTKKEKAVIEAWSELRDHLYSYPQKPGSEVGSENSKMDMYIVQMETWASKKNDLLIELLSKMAKSLGYHFDKVILKKGSYTPQKYGDFETMQTMNLAALSEIFLGRRSIPIHIVGVPPTEGKQDTKEVASETTTNDTV